MKGRPGSGAIGVLLLAAVFLVVGCAVPRAKAGGVREGVPALVAADEALSLADDLTDESLLLAVDRSLSYYERLPQDAWLNFGNRQVPAAQVKETLTAFREIAASGDPPEAKARKIRETFTLWRAAPSGEILLTGYYEPELKGSPVMTAEFRYPIYGAPAEIAGGTNAKGEAVWGTWRGGAFVPYYSRREIDEEGVLAGRGLEIAWLADPVERFFLHVQGSGRITFPDGTTVRVGYARSNGRPYRSINAHLLATGRITPRENSYAAVKRFLQARPEGERLSLLSYNECYVFFARVSEGPRGALGVPLVPGRAIAVDAAVYPKGGIAFLRARKPAAATGGNGTALRMPFSRFVLAQDAGIAIKGPGRVDLFCGTGRDAEWLAGSLKDRGELYFLLKK